MNSDKPANWRQMCDAWDDAAEFARQCQIYYASLAPATPDITQPRYSRDDTNALSGD